MSRVALLPAGADPFLVAYWLRNYARVWADEVDRLWVHVAGQQDRNVIYYLRDLVAAVPHVELTWQPQRETHGAVMRRMADTLAPEDLLVFLEDDAFVRYPGVIGGRFALIEAGDVDVVGTARGNATDNLIMRAEERFGKPVETITGETGNSLFPCFLFIRRRDLPDVRLDPISLPPGSYLPELDYTCTQDEGFDTFTQASWALRAAGLRIQSEAAFRSDKAWRDYTLDAPWFHVGSLSSGYGSAFMPQRPTTDAQVRIYWEQIRNPQETYDWTKRCAWWERAWELWDGGIPEHHREYGERFEEFKRYVGIDPTQVAVWRHHYDPLVMWDERP